MVCVSCSFWKRMLKWFGRRQTPSVHKGMIDVFVPSKKWPTNCNGIGDTLMALPIVHAVAAKYPEKIVRMRVAGYNFKWAQLGWNILAPADVKKAGLAETVFHMTPESYIEIDLEARSRGISRMEIQGLNCDGVSPKWFEPRISPEALAWGREQVASHCDGAKKKTVLLAPFARWAHRNWPLLYWIKLEQALTKEGYTCLVLTGNGNGSELGWFDSAGWFGLEAQKTAGLAMAADLIISNDSGMAHLGGILKKPTIAICAPTDGEVLYGSYETVHVIQAEGPCTGCYFKKELGWRLACSAACELFLDLKPWRINMLAKTILETKLPLLPKLKRAVKPVAPLPVHFLTLVLNGEPFIRWHIEQFKKLPFKWHWHIVEGAAERKFDTKTGGEIADSFHRNGRSVDGTSEYIDQLVSEHPNNVTVYRKPELWRGKVEMANAPLEKIKEECLLWQVDVDELWTAEQVVKAHKMFADNPTKTAARYWCEYFVGPGLSSSKRGSYGNYDNEWLRTWRFKPGCFWLSHVSPKLCSAQNEIDLGSLNPFTQAETEQNGLVFQHFAYVLESQVRFKEVYYGYKDAVVQWRELQLNTQFPAPLNKFLSWVDSSAMVDRSTVAPLLVEQLVER